MDANLGHALEPLQKSLEQRWLVVFRNVSTGFAARCEEWLCPAANAKRRYAVTWHLGDFPGSEGAAQSEVQPNGKAQPFLTSGGEAGATLLVTLGTCFDFCKSLFSLSRF